MSSLNKEAVIALLAEHDLGDAGFILDEIKSGRYDQTPEDQDVCKNCQKSNPIADSEYCAECCGEEDEKYPLSLGD